MNVFSVLAFFALALQAAFPAAASLVSPRFGPSSGGGGYAIQCPDPATGKAVVQALDLWEGRNLLGFEMAPSAGDLEKDYLGAVARTYALQGRPDLAEEMRTQTLRNFARFFAAVAFVERPEDLPVAEDLGSPPQIPASCELRQIAYYDDLAQKPFILRPAWEQMDALDQAALIEHELSYREARFRRDRTSEFARREVAHMFAARGPVPLSDGLTPASHPMSASSQALGTEHGSGVDEKSLFYLTPMSDARGPFLRLQFIEIQGRPLLAKTWVDLPQASWDLQTASASGGAQCVVAGAGPAVDAMLPLLGALTSGMSVHYRYAAGEPIRIDLWRGRDALGTTIVDGGAACAGAIR